MTYDPIGKYNSSLETETYFEPDTWESDRINIKSGTETKGYIKQDTWESDRFNFYDKNGKRTGIYLEKDPWESDRINIKRDRCIQINSQTDQTIKAGFSNDPAFFISASNCTKVQCLSFPYPSHLGTH